MAEFVPDYAAAGAMMGMPATAVAAPSVVDVSKKKVRRPSAKKTKKTKKNTFLSKKQTPIQKFRDRQNKIKNAVFLQSSMKKLGKMNPFKGIQMKQPKFVQGRVNEACYTYALPRAGDTKQLKKLWRRCDNYVTKLRQNEPKRLQDVSQYIIDGMTDVKETFLPTAGEKKLAFNAYRAHRANKRAKERDAKKKVTGFVPSAALAALQAAQAKTRSFPRGKQTKEKAKAKATEDMARALWKESLKPKKAPLKKRST